MSFLSLSTVRLAVMSKFYIEPLEYLLSGSRIIDPGDVLQVAPLAEGTMRDRPQAPAHL